MMIMKNMRNMKKIKVTIIMKSPRIIKAAINLAISCILLFMIQVNVLNQLKIIIKIQLIDRIAKPL